MESGREQLEFDFMKRREDNFVYLTLLGGGTGLLAVGSLLLYTYYKTSDTMPEFIEYFQNLSDKLP